LTGATILSKATDIYSEVGSHFKIIGVHTFPLQIGVLEVKIWSAFGVNPQKRNMIGNPILTSCR
jgi:hypothetical protein